MPLNYLLIILMCMVCCNRSVEKLVCSDESLVIIEVLDNLEDIYFPPLKEFRDQKINNFNLCNCYNGGNWEAELNLVNSFIKKSLDPTLVIGNMPLTTKECLTRSTKTFGWINVNKIDTIADVIILTKPIIELNRAVLEVAWIPDRHSSSSYIIFLEKDRGSWKIVNKFQTWIG